MGVRDADGHKLSLYPREVNLVLDGDLDHSLLQVEIGVTNLCNHRCSYCSVDWINRDGKFIKKEAMLLALRDMAEMGVSAEEGASKAATGAVKAVGDVAGSSMGAAKDAVSGAFHGVSVVVKDD